jgi:nucleotide-binding universal stress UspA family protein
VTVDEMTASIHKASGATAKVPKVNLEALSLDTLKAIVEILSRWLPEQEPVYHKKYSMYFHYMPSVFQLHMHVCLPRTSDAGRVHLLHVHVPGGDKSPDADAELRARVIPGAASASVEVVVGEDVAAAVCAAAARLGADVICIATHGRSGVSRALMGSQAEQVVRRAGRPVVLVPPADG